MTNSRDTQEVLLEPGREILKIFKSYRLKTSILDDFAYYNKQEEQERLARESAKLQNSAPASPVSSPQPAQTLPQGQPPVKRQQQPQPKQNTAVSSTPTSTLRLSSTSNTTSESIPKAQAQSNQSTNHTHELNHKNKPVGSSVTPTTTSSSSSPKTNAVRIKTNSTKST